VHTAHSRAISPTAVASAAGVQQVSSDCTVPHTRNEARTVCSSQYAVAVARYLTRFYVRWPPVEGWGSGGVRSGVLGRGLGCGGASIGARTWNRAGGGNFCDCVRVSGAWFDSCRFEPGARAPARAAPHARPQPPHRVSQTLVPGLYGRGTRRPDAVHPTDYDSRLLRLTTPQAQQFTHKPAIQHHTADMRPASLATARQPPSSRAFYAHAISMRAICTRIRNVYSYVYHVAGAKQGTLAPPTQRAPCQVRIGRRRRPRSPRSTPPRLQ
jgi:hypothetical protein